MGHYGNRTTEDGAAARGRIPSLDGLRAFSITMVVIGHAATRAPAGAVQRVLGLVGRAELGVDIFFVLSGYLITRLLVSEQRRNGVISLRGFYLRRVFRIFPALYAYVFVMALLSKLRVVDISLGSFADALAFTWNYGAFGKGEWWFGHFWSLAVEEQFYLAWPLLLTLAGTRRARTIAVAVIASEPFVRTLTYVTAPSLRPFIPVMGHTRVDTLLFGCVLAMLQADPAWDEWLRRHVRGPVVGAAIAMLVVSQTLVTRFVGAWQLPFGFSCEGLAIAVIVCRSMTNDRAVTRLLNASPVTWLGRVSYSLYMWQQPWLAHEGFWVAIPLPVSVACALACAAGSYYFIEQPMLRLRDEIVARRRVQVVEARPNAQA
jgi:peptidoglycan/LPS O-acetylase OafA/YrhL